jgi:exodeoxyribonuclease VII large subunit
MLQMASRRAEVDLLLLVRGGGSIEDLWAFNEEAVARAIRDCAIPVVVGVGHESDVTIADFAADLRAPTPTAAAEMAAPDRLRLLQQVESRSAQMQRVVRGVLQQRQQRLDYAQRALASPRAPLQVLAARIQALAARAGRASSGRVARLRRRCDELAGRLARTAPSIGPPGHRLHRRAAALVGAARELLLRRERRLHAAAARLQALDPLAVLARGYALATDDAGRVVTDAARIAEGDLLRLRFARGSATARVLHTEPAAGEPATTRPAT